MRGVKTYHIELVTGLSIKKYHIQKITSRQTSFPQLSWFSVKVFSNKIVQWTHILIWKHVICSQVFLVVTRPFLNKVFDCVSIGKSNIWKWELRTKYSQNLIFYIMQNVPKMVSHNLNKNTAAFAEWNLNYALPFWDAMH